MAIDTKLMTAEEFATMEPDDGNSELIRGEYVKMPPPGFEHGDIVISIGTILKTYVKRQRLGRVVSDGGFRIEHDPDTVLAPDVAFVSSDQINRSTVPRAGYPNVPPELVFEVISPSDYAELVDRKISIYLKTGVKMVVTVWPRDRKLTVMSSDRPPLTLFEGDILDLAEVITGLSFPVSEIFE